MGNSYSRSGVLDGARNPQLWPADLCARDLYGAVWEGDTDALITELQRQDAVNLRDVEKNVPILVMSSDQLRGGSSVLGSAELELLRRFLQGDYSSLCQRTTFLSQLTGDSVYIVGMTPLQVACMAGHAGCVSLLLRMGADPEAMETRRGAIERVRGHVGTVICPLTPTQLAAANGHEDCLEKLLESSAHQATLVTKARGATTIHISQTPPLHLAAVLKRPNCLKTLISRGASLDERDKTDMAETFGRRQVQDNLCLQKILHYAYGSVDAAPGLRGMSAVHHACKSANTTCLEVLLEHGADCSFPGDRQKSPLYILCTQGARFKNRHGVTDGSFVHCLRLLLNYGANCIDDIDMTDTLLSKLLSAGLAEACLVNCALMLMNSSPSSTQRTHSVPHEHFQWRPLARGVDCVSRDTPGNNRQQMAAVQKYTNRGAVEPTGKSDSPTARNLLNTFYPTYIDDRGRLALPDSLVEVLVSFHSQPRRLTDLSRLAIREALGGQVQRNIGKLKLPSALKKFVLLQDEYGA